MRLKPHNSPLSEWLLVCLAMAVPIAIITAWHHAQHYYPRHDSAYYFETAQLIYLKLKSQGVLGGFAEAYFHCEYKPILHPLFIVPFLFLTGGKVLSSIAMTNIFFFIFFFVFTYLLFREFLNKHGALIATLTVATMGWVFGSLQAPMSELPQLAATMATLFYLKRSDYFASRRNSIYFGISLALCLCIRPVESTMLLIAPMALWIREGYLRKHVSPRALRASAAAFGLSVAIISVSLILNKELSLIGFVVSLAALAGVLYWAVFFKLKKNAPSEGYSLAFFLGCGLTMLWFLPSVLKLYRWVFAATFGASTMSEVGKERLGLKLLINSFWDLGGFPLILAAALAIVTCFALKKNQPALKKQEARDRKILLIAIVCMVLVPPLFGGIAYNRDTRYYYPGAAITLMLACVVALDQHRRFMLPRAAVLLFLCFINIMVWASDAELVPFRVKSRYRLLIRGVPLWTIDDPILTYTKEIQPRIKSRPLTVCVLPLFSDGVFDDVINDSSLNVMAREVDSRLRFRCEFLEPMPQDKNAAFKNFQDGLESVDFLVIGPLESRKVYRESTSRYADFILDLWDAKKLEPTRLRFDKIFMITDNMQQQHEMALFRVEAKR